MSSCKSARFTCPQCGHKQSMTIWASVNVSVDPTLKKRVLEPRILRGLVMKSQPFDPSCAPIRARITSGYALVLGRARLKAQCGVKRLNIQPVQESVVV